MAAGSTYTPIATTTLGSAASSVTFSSIAGTYTDLRIVYSTVSSADAGNYLRFNSDSGSNYSNTTLFGNGSSAGSNRNTSSTGMYGAFNSTVAVVGLWRNTAAITQVVVFCDGANFASGSTFTLYGILAA
jgi:hypothetical protein